MNKIVCKCGGSNFLKHDSNCWICLDCGVECIEESTSLPEQHEAYSFYDVFMDNYDYYYIKYLSCVAEMEMEEYFSEYSEPDWERLMSTVQQDELNKMKLS